MKSAIVCTSPIHILRTLEIIYYEEYFQGDIEVIVSSLCPNYEFIVRNMSHIYKISAVYAVNMEQLQNKGLVKLMFGKCSFSEILKRNKYTKLTSTVATTTTETTTRKISVRSSLSAWKKLNY